MQGKLLPSGRTFLPTARQPLHRVHTAAAVGLAVLGAACGDPGEVVAPPTSGSVTPSTPYEAVQSIFTRNCAFSGCHSGPDPQEGMDLGPAAFHANVVAVPSRQVPSLFRVEAGRPDSSYVMLKLRGLAGAVGGIGTQMPLGGQLTPAQIDTVRLWIQSGAPGR